MVLKVCLRCMIVVFPDDAHLLKRLRCFRILSLLCVIIYVDSGVHDYVLTKTESGAKIWSVKYVYSAF